MPKLGATCTILALLLIGGCDQGGGIANVPAVEIAGAFGLHTMAADASASVEPPAAADEDQKAIGLILKPLKEMPRKRKIMAFVLAWLLFPLGFKLGGAFGKLGQPDIILAEDGADLALKRISYAFLPLTCGLFGGLVGIIAAIAIAYFI
jgi:hypothetical protein